jgi:thiosulfate/3-mercaptopyruvate sulfurtransferase
MMTTPLVSAPALRELLGRERAEPGRLVLLDVRAGEAGLAAYEREHLAGAHHADLDRDLADISGDPRAGGRHPLPALADWCRTLGRWGITPSTFVVCYDAAAGALAASRAWWMLRAVGHQRVAVLDGGWAAAVATELPLATRRPPESKAAPYPAASWSAPMVTVDEVAAAAGDPEKVIVDARARTRFLGHSEPFDPVAGRIPGAVNLPHEEVLDTAGRWLAPAALRERLASVGADRGRDVIVHCGSGVTACQLCLAAEAAGLELPSLYVGSWSEWCRNERQIATGESTE